MAVKWLSEAPRIALAAIAVGIATAALSAAAYFSSPVHAAPPKQPTGGGSSVNSGNTNSLNGNTNSFNNNSNNNNTSITIKERIVRDPSPQFLTTPKPWMVNQTLPGIAVSMVFAVGDVTEMRRKYFFEYKDQEGAASSLYLSANDMFEFSVTDLNAKTYTLDIPLGNEGIPLDKAISLICEEGGTSNKSFMLASINGKIVSVKSFPERINLGSRSWHNATALGSDAEGNELSTMEFEEFAMWAKTIDQEHLIALWNNVRDHYFGPAK